MEQSVYIIKPDGMIHQHAIREHIERAGLVIVNPVEVLIPRWAIEKLSERLPKEIQETMKNDLFGKMCEIGIVQGQAAVEKLLNLCANFDHSTPSTVLPSDKKGEQRPKLKNIINQPHDDQEVLRYLYVAYRLHIKK